MCLWRGCFAFPRIISSWYRTDKSAGSNHLLPRHWEAGTPFSSSSPFLAPNLAALNLTWYNSCPTECRKVRETLCVDPELFT